ncbi:MAG: hypothetical protein M0C28_44890 [Candidatus Moduliflexus flocculans]|nr:hypothetical protein [Candidatus Moduliflexus flocculans]
MSRRPRPCPPGHGRIHAPGERSPFSASGRLLPLLDPPQRAQTTEEGPRAAGRGLRRRARLFLAPPSVPLQAHRQPIRACALPPASSPFS